MNNSDSNKPVIPPAGDNGRTINVGQIIATMAALGLAAASYYLASCECGHSRADHDHGDYFERDALGGCKAPGCKCVAYRFLRRPVAKAEQP